MKKNNLAKDDILKAIQKYSLIHLLGWQDILGRYKRSSLGPFWLTLSMGFMIATMGIVFGTIFNVDLKVFFPYLAIGIILWGYVAIIITEGCNVFIDNDAMIKQLPLPLFTYILRMIWRNTLILGHNILIFPLVLIMVGQPITSVAFLAIPGFILLVSNLLWVSIILSVICARYRDMPQIITSILQVVFYATPIMWIPDNISNPYVHILVNFNPVYHLLELIREPLIGHLPTLDNWIISIILCIFGWIIALRFYSIFKPKVAYWL